MVGAMGAYRCSGKPPEQTDRPLSSAPRPRARPHRPWWMHLRKVRESISNVMMFLHTTSLILGVTEILILESFYGTLLAPSVPRK
jgi:hypothetical protein